MYGGIKILLVPCSHVVTSSKFIFTVAVTRPRREIGGLVIPTEASNLIMSVKHWYRKFDCVMRRTILWHTLNTVTF